MIDNKIDFSRLKILYQMLHNILIAIEGDKPVTCDAFNYVQSQKIPLPLNLLPLLHSGAVCVQMGLVLLPYYMTTQEYEPDEMCIKETIDFFKNNISEYTPYSSELMKFFFQDMIRVSPIKNISDDWGDTKNSEMHHITHHSKIILYDKMMTKIPSVSAIEIDDFYKNDSDETERDYILLGDASHHKIKTLEKIIQEKPLYGIAPQKENNTLHNLEKRMMYFSQSTFAGVINIHLPFINHFFDYGLSPIRFYYDLCRSSFSKNVIQNALSLMNLKHPSEELCSELNYIRLIPYTEMIEHQNETMKTVNYLHLLACDTVSNL